MADGLASFAAADDGERVGSGDAFAAITLAAVAVASRAAGFEAAGAAAAAASERNADGTDAEGEDDANAVSLRARAKGLVCETRAAGG